MARYIISILLIINSRAMSQDYTVAEYDELYGIINSNEGAFMKQLKSNLAKAYRLKDERIVLLPYSGSIGLLILNESILNKMIEEDYFPVPGGYERPLISERERIKKLEDNIPYFINQLSGLLEIKLTNDNGELIVSDNLLVKVSEKLNKIKDKEDLFLKALVPLIVYVGECIRKQTDTYWKTEKVYYTLNAYWDLDLWTNNDQHNVGVRAVVDRSIFSKRTDLLQVVKSEIGAIRRSKLRR